MSTDTTDKAHGRIGNLPGASIVVQFPSGASAEINLIVLLAQVQHAEMMARFGHGLARNAPTIAELRDFYEIPSNVRTWKALAPMLRRFHTDLSEFLDTQHAA